MILSIGGTPQPLVKSIQEHGPDAVCFLASQGSVEIIPKVRSALAQMPRDFKVVVDNHEDFLDCYGGAHRCWQWLEKEALTDSVTIDFTGGTKVMSVALAMLGIQKGCQFVYVGGTQRTRDGLGQVVDGTERVFEGANPWHALAVEERREGITYFNQFQFAAAGQAFARGHRIVKAQLGHLEVLLGILQDLANAYDLWDRFRHREARQALRGAYDGLNTYVRITANRQAERLGARIRTNVEFLDKLTMESRGFQVACQLHVLDLLGNAERRAQEGRFDDGVIRLYRALELLAHLALRQRGVDPGEERLGLEDSFQRLFELGDPLGRLFEEKKTSFRKVQFARNYSWLVHDMKVLDKDTYDRLRDLVYGLAGAQPEQAPSFPILEGE